MSRVPSPVRKHWNNGEVVEQLAVVAVFPERLPEHVESAGGLVGQHAAYLLPSLPARLRLASA
jgi:hypothetical protein